jgi:hypothetical protein
MVFYYETNLQGHELFISNFMQFNIKLGVTVARKLLPRLAHVSEETT